MANQNQKPLRQTVAPKSNDKYVNDLKQIYAQRLDLIAFEYKVNEFLHKLEIYRGRS